MVTKKDDHMINDYKIGEGDAIGYLPAEYKTGVAVAIGETSLKAAEDIKKGQVVKVSGSFEVSVATKPTDVVLGVAMFDTDAGDPISVEAEGLFKLTAGANIDVSTNPKVAASDNGTVSPVATGGNSIGIAIGNADKDKPVYVKFSI